MLDNMRKWAAGPFAAILIGLLVLAFAVWGIADIFGGGGARAVATVGDVEISPNEFSRNLRRDIRSFSERMRRDLTTDEAKLLGIDRAVFNRLVNGALVDNHAQSLGLGITQQAVLDDLAKDPAFQGIGGRFDKERFAQLLDSNQMTEAAFINAQKRGVLRRQITDAMLFDVSAPKTLISIKNIFDNQQRKLKVIEINEKTIGKIEKPDEATLKSFFDQRKSQYRAPEFRKLGSILLTPDTMADKVEISDAELKAGFETRKAGYATPEKRRIEQISFKDEKAANQARRKIKRPQNFVRVAKKLGFTDKDILLGTVTEDEMIDPVIAKAAFALKKGRVSKPIKGTFSTVILRVSKVIKATEKTFEQVQGDIKKELTRQKAAKQISGLHESVEEERAAGTPLKEIAEKINVAYIEISAIDQRGMDADGKPVANFSTTPKLLNNAFKGEAGEEIDPIDLPGNGIAWLEVLDITESKIRDFDKVKDKAGADWKAKQLRERLSKKANALIAEAKSGKSFAKLAKSVGKKLEITEPFKRTGTPKDFPSGAVSLAFTLPKNGMSSTTSTSGKSRLVYQVSEIIPAPKLKEGDEKSTKAALIQQMTDDIVSQYVRGLKGRFEVTVNQKVFDQITGR